MKINEIKSNLTIQQVLKHYNLIANKNNLLNCLFHEDKTASLQVYPKTNTYHCFGCGKTGDVIQFIEDYEKCSKHEAIIKAKELTGIINLPKETKPLQNMQETFSKLQQSLQRSPKAKDYLQSRNIDLTANEIGYNSGTGYNKMKYCIIFPLKDKQNGITSFYGRSVIDNTNSKHYYSANRKGLYPNYPQPETTKLILTEAIIDTATILQIPEVTKEFTILSLYGTNGLTEEHKRAISELSQLQEIILFFDGDEPGREATRKHAETLQQLKPGIKVSYVQTPDGEDLNSLSVKYDNNCLLQLLSERLLFSIEKENMQQPRQQNHGLNITNSNKISYATGTAIYYIKGGLRKELDSLRVSLVIENPITTIKSRSKLDLYEDKQVEKLSREASEKLGLRADLLEMDLSAMTDLLEEYRETQLSETETGKPKYQLPPTTIAECTSFLKQVDLINRINQLIGRSGVIGEEHNRLFLFVIASSYKMPDTLHALIQGSSGSGKTHLLSKIGGLIPPEDSIFLTRVTESSFYNYDEKYFNHKLLCMEDLDGLKEEAYLAFRELQSKGMLTSSTSIKNENGTIQGFVKTVKGPIASLSATTKGEIYEDNMSRIFLIAVNESNEQTGRIIKYQNEKAAGLIDVSEEKEIIRFIQNTIRILKPYPVINPYAHKILLPQEAHKIRRLTELYHAFVKQITLINQYQRKKDAQGRLITQKEDLFTANEIMFESIILKIDELDGSLRQFYEQLKQYIQSKGNEYQNYQFAQREIRQALNMSKSQLQRYINDLLDLEYLQQSGGYQNRGYKYKITYWDNIEALRLRIRNYLNDQIKNL
ncbi:MAG: toprim domain-containing protein [Bacteroidales bacterium]|nr:toprim domain-containing protein [Bacteroidales bacterium]